MPPTCSPEARKRLHRRFTSLLAASWIDFRRILVPFWRPQTLKIINIPYKTNDSLKCDVFAPGPSLDLKKTFKIDPWGSQRRPKSSPRVPKELPKGPSETPRTLPRAPQEAARASQRLAHAPSMLKTCSACSKHAQNTLKTCSTHAEACSILRSPLDCCSSG